MTPKEKAKELMDKYKPLCGGYWGGKINKEFAKQCALIAVDEIINGMDIFIHLIGDMNWSLLEHTIDSKNHYWQSVKEEIEKL